MFAGLSGFFAAEGRLVARYPWTTIIISLVVTLICMAGFIRFSVEQDADLLYTPNDAQVRRALHAAIRFGG